MTIREIIARTGGTIRCGEHRGSDTVTQAFCSDLMSDVLTLNCQDLILITGLANVQAIRTAEMADIPYVLFVRDKDVTDEMVRIGKENNMVLAQCSCSMFKAAGELYKAGLKPVF